MKCIGLLLGVVATVTIACGPSNDASSVGTTGTSGTVGNDTAASSPAPAIVASSGDKDFVTDLTIANMAEVEFGKLALERGARPDVKRFGQMMIDDHTVAGDRLRAIAMEHSIPAPGSLDESHQQLHAKLSALKGAAFDRAYMDAMVDGHEKVLGKLESRIDRVSLNDWKTRVGEVVKGQTNPEPPQVVPEAGNDPIASAINQWSAGTYAGVYRHLQSAKAIDEMVKGRPAKTQ